MTKKADKQKTYLFGPVPSRRLGLSLGVDIVPFKYCTLDCVYCQLGATTDETIERKAYVPVDKVLNELKARLNEGVKADYITLSGSGEPTLNSELGLLIDGIKKITKIPVAVLTNATLLNNEDVRRDCKKADVVLPSLDAGDQQVFEKVNRPSAQISFKDLVIGLKKFRQEYTGQIWLEVFLVKGLNITSEQITKIKEIIAQIRPDRIQLNTAVRPTTEMNIERMRLDEMQEFADKISPTCEVIADFKPKGQLPEEKNIESKGEYLLSMLKRRPCSLEDICAGLGIHRNEALKYIAHFQNDKLVATTRKTGKTFYQAI